MTGPAGYLDLERVVIPNSLALAANEHLRIVGQKGFEGFVLWTGRRQGPVFEVIDTFIPAQKGVRTDMGVCVTVDGDELFRLNKAMYERGLQVVAQLHSHPGEAYHSDTDDAFPIATTVGALSLVIPDFAEHPFSLDRCAVYRLLPRRGWTHLTSGQARALVQFYDD